MNAVVDHYEAAPELGAQFWRVVLECGHTVIRKPPLPKDAAYCAECDDAKASPAWREEQCR